MNVTKTLYKWWDRDRLDNYTTTHPGWIPRRLGESRSPNYRYVGTEGEIFDPDSPQPPETDPLFTWFDPDRVDNHTTTAPVWHGSPGDHRSPNYRFSRHEGFVFTRPIAGTWPLYRWWSPGRTDNHTTTTWLPDEDVRHLPDYGCSRLEGYVLPNAGKLSPVLATAIGYRRPFLRNPMPLLLILVEFADAKLAHPNSYYESLVLGPSPANLSDYFAAISYGKFRWTRAGVFRVSFSRNAADELADISEWSERLMREVARQGFDYGRFIKDSDGITTRNGLCVMRIVATYNPSFQGGGSTAPLPSMSIGGTPLALHSSNCDEQGEMMLFAHELLHQLYDADHIYGPGARLNYRASPLAGTTIAAAANAGSVHLDPWNKMKIGWMQPRVVPITHAGGVALINAAWQGSYSDNSGSPIVFYDPQRGTKEMFIVEYRTPYPDVSYDSNVLGQGIAVWYVQRDSSGSVVKFNWPPPIVPQPLGNMWANYLVGPNGFGAGPFWRPEDGEFKLQWGNGEECALRLRVGPLGDTSPFAILQWRHRDVPFLPRIDDVRPSHAGPGAILVLDGVFGVRDHVACVMLEGKSGRHLLDIESWDISRLTARISENVPPGAYLLRVYSARSMESGGNTVMFHVDS